MANKEIADLTAASTLTGTEKIHGDQGGNSRRFTVSDILTFVLGKVSVWLKPQRKTVVTVTAVSNVFNPDFDLANSFNLGTLTADATLEGGTNGPGANTDQCGEITVDLDGFTLTVDATGWDFKGGTAETLSGKCTLHYRLWHDGTTLQKRILSVSAWG